MHHVDPLMQDTTGCTADLGIVGRVTGGNVATGSNVVMNLKRHPRRMRRIVSSLLTRNYGVLAVNRCLRPARHRCPMTSCVAPSRFGRCEAVKLGGKFQRIRDTPLMHSSCRTRGRVGFGKWQMGRLCVFFIVGVWVRVREVGSLLRCGGLVVSAKLVPTVMYVVFYVFFRSTIILCIYDLTDVVCVLCELIGPPICRPGLMLLRKALTLVVTSVVGNVDKSVLVPSQAIPVALRVLVLYFSLLCLVIPGFCAGLFSCFRCGVSVLGY